MLFCRTFYLIISLTCLHGIGYSQTTVVSPGEWEIKYAHSGARPQFAYDAFKNLPYIWNRPDIAFNSPQYWSEMEARYGLQQAPWPNNGLPVGVNMTEMSFVGGENARTFADFPVVDTIFQGRLFPRLANRIRSRARQNTARRQGVVRGVSVNCQLCHTAGLFSRDYPGGVINMGTPNVFVDYQKFYEDMNRASGFPYNDLFKRNPPRNSMVNLADFIARLVDYQRPNPWNNRLDKERFAAAHGAFTTNSRFDRIVSNQIRRYSGEIARLKAEQRLYANVKTQPWFNVDKKYKGTENQGAYVTGGFRFNHAAIDYGNAFSFREDGSDYEARMAAFDRYGMPYIKSMKAPRYPFADDLDEEKVLAGHAVFEDACAHCHGSYEKVDQAKNKFFQLSYPGRVVPIEEINTDPLRRGIELAKIRSPRMRKLLGEVTPGYTAPPLDGIWARAPYLHNASVPTLRLLLSDPSSRPESYAIYARPRDPNNYDHKNVGWKYYSVNEINLSDPGWRIYDPRVVGGLSNQGHDMSAAITDETDLDNLLEFLKSL